MVPVIAAPKAYLVRVGPKPMAFGAPPRPLAEVLAKLPPLESDLPPRPGSGPASETGDSAHGSELLWPTPFQSEATGTGHEFPRLPDNWLESLLGNGFPLNDPPSPLESVGPENATPPPIGTSQPSLSPETLIQFFLQPGSQRNSGFTIPVPFVPGTPSQPNSSKAIFRQD